MRRQTMISSLLTLTLLAIPLLNVTEVSSSKPNAAPGRGGVQVMHTIAVPKPNYSPGGANSPLLKVTPMMGEQPVLVVLVQYSNRKFTTPMSEWRNKYFSLTGKSLVSYYRDLSQGKLTLVPAKETSGEANDGVVQLTLDSPHPDLADQLERSPDAARTILQATDEYVDYKSYDKNGDGEVTPDELHVAFVLAGFEASTTTRRPSMWAHQFVVWYNPPRLDGKTVGYSGYTMQGELTPDGSLDLGTIAHEFGHDLGLPDMYDYDGSSEGVGIHSLMAYGVNGRTSTDESLGETPVHLDAWSRIKLGWIEPQVVNLTYEPQTISLYSHDTGKFNVLRVNTPNPNEYFLIENRQLVGFDAGLQLDLSEGGIAVWHIDNSVLMKEQNINDNDKQRAIDVIRANSVFNQGTLARRPYFALDGIAKWNSNTQPSSMLYDGNRSFIALDVLSKNGGEMKVTLQKERNISVVPPTVEPVSDLSKAIVGKTSPNTHVEIYVANNSSVFYTGTSDSSGLFRIDIQTLPAQSNVLVRAFNTAKTDYVETAVQVVDKTPPNLKAVRIVNGKVTGKADPNTTVEVIGIGKKFVAKVNASGSFNVNLTGLSKGTKVIIYAVDESGNRSVAITRKL